MLECGCRRRQFLGQSILPRAVVVISVGGDHAAALQIVEVPPNLFVGPLTKQAQQCRCAVAAPGRFAWRSPHKPHPLKQGMAVGQLLQRLHDLSHQLRTYVAQFGDLAAGDQFPLRATSAQSVQPVAVEPENWVFLPKFWRVLHLQKHVGAVDHGHGHGIDRLLR